MKKIISLFLLATLFSTVVKADIEFNHSPWQEILNQATQQKKLVFVDAYTTWCGPCKWMAANTFTNPEVSEFFNANFINAKIDMENGEGIGLAQKYHVNAYPTLLFVAGNGELVHVAIGALDPEKFIALGKSVLDPNFATMANLKAKYAAGNYDRHFLAEYIVKMRESGENVDAALESFKAGMAGDALLQEDNWNVFKALFMKLDSDQAKYFLAHRDAFIKLYGAEEVNYKAMIMYSGPVNRAIYNGGSQNEYDEARKVLAQSGIPGADIQALMMDVTWFQQRQDWKQYAKAATKAVDAMPEVSPVMLNSFAWTFYENIDDAKLLKKALVWATKACELMPDYALLDTKAMVQMKLGMTKDAIATAEAAIAKAKETGEDYAATQEALDQMKGK